MVHVWTGFLFLRTNKGKTTFKKKSYPVSAMISGATYVGVPQTVYSGPSTTVAKPKSPSFSDLVPSGYSHTCSTHKLILPIRTVLLQKGNTKRKSIRLFKKKKMSNYSLSVFFNSCSWYSYTYNTSFIQ